MLSSPLAAMLALLAMAAPQFSERLAGEIVSDYPVWALEKNLSAAVVYTVFVDPKGRVLRCDNIATVGSEELAKHVCGQLRRARVEPAVDRTGTPIYGKIYNLIKLAIPDTELGRKVGQVKMKPDVELTVASLPPDLGSSTKVTVNVLVGEGGKVAECEGKTGESDRFAAAACSALLGQDLAVEKDREGLAVPYAQEMTVAFSVSS